MKKIIIDSSSAILLFKVNVFTQLYNCYDLFISKSVFKELTIRKYDGGLFFKELILKKHLKIIDLDNNVFYKYKNNKHLNILGKGECDSIIISLEKQVDFMIVDDKKACLLASKYKLNFVNALLFLKILFFKKNISTEKFKEEFERLCKIGYYSNYIKQFVLDVTEPELTSFI